MSPSDLRGPAPCARCGYNGPGYYQPDTHPCAVGLQGLGRPISRDEALSTSAETMAQAEQQRADALRGPGEDFGPDLTAEGRIPAPGSGGAITDAPYLDDLRRGYAPGDAALYAQIDRLTRERDAVETKLRVALEGLHAASALLRAAEGERDVARAALQTAHDWIAGGVEYDAAQEAHWEVRARRALGKNP